MRKGFNNNGRLSIMGCLSLILALCMASCTGQKKSDVEEPAGDAGTMVYCFNDSCQHLIMSLSLEVPMGKDSASMLIRDSLIADFMRNAAQPDNIEESAAIKPYVGDMSDIQAMVDYYGKEGYDRLLKMAKTDYEERMKYLEEDTTMSEEDKEMIGKDVPMWAFDLKVSKVMDTLDIVVYDSQTYCYYGGAHGGVVGSGAMTFDKGTGSKIRRFLNADATTALQPLIRKGLLEYYKEAGDPITDRQLSERLQIEGKIIPQPVRTPYPNASADSLIFIYGQYEIACYADGMPAFRLAVKDIEQHLTKEGKALLMRK